MFSDAAASVPAGRTAVRMEHFSVSFFGRTIVDDVSLSIPDRGVFAIMGRSGSGKTTLLRSINRLNDEFPGCRTAGRLEVCLDGVMHTVYAEGASPGMDVHALRRRVGMVFQTPQVFPMSVRRNIELPLSVASGTARSERDDRVKAALVMAGLWEEVADRLDSPAERLSGGQQQRLCLARALALDPQILLVDEPTASLDVEASRRIEDLLASLGEGRAVVMVSHNPEQGLRIASDIAIMREGRMLPVPDREGLSAEGLARMLRGASENPAGGME
ncbi:MAG: ATP-binding cassette domain-containing protein [Mailhella sp.]|nr:ATP-binding cassette domain-containing protein [Mailhella sp.]